MPSMLDDFIVMKRDTIIARTQARVASRPVPTPTEVELKHGIPLFLDQLGDALRIAKSTTSVDHDQLDKTAGLHGGDLLTLPLPFGPD